MQNCHRQDFRERVRGVHSSVKDDPQKAVSPFNLQCSQSVQSQYITYTGGIDRP